jgi:hypothetical protein
VRGESMAVAAATVAVTVLLSLALGARESTCWRARQTRESE